ncbi:MAG: hypothetical protein K2W95_09450 [Candidatus Obscuribacterales bacterium]|nr:hypothetical protein [Candidatus Obscuribacterales bacterium]
MDNDFDMDEEALVEAGEETEGDEEGEDLVDQDAAAERLLDESADAAEALAEGGAVGAAAAAAAEALAEGGAVGAAAAAAAEALGEAGAAAAAAAAARAAEGHGAVGGIAEGLSEKEVINKLEKIGSLENLKNPEALLNRTERMLLNQLHGALKAGDMKSVQEMLATIAENPKSVASVMNAMKARLESSNPLNHVRWEQGKDSDGNSFVRLHIDQTHSHSKSSGSTRVMIGSDGTNTASSNKTWDSPRRNVDPAEALRDVTGAAWRNLKPFNVKPNAQGTLQELLQGAESTLENKKKK